MNLLALMQQEALLTVLRGTLIRARQARRLEPYQVISDCCDAFHTGETLAYTDIASKAALRADEPCLSALVSRYPGMFTQDARQGLSGTLTDHAWASMLGIETQPSTLIIDVGYGVPSVPYTNNPRAIEALVEHSSPILPFSELIERELKLAAPVDPLDKDYLRKTYCWAGSYVTNVRTIVLLRRAYKAWVSHPTPRDTAILSAILALRPAVALLDASCRDVLTPCIKLEIAKTPNPILAGALELEFDDDAGPLSLTETCLWACFPQREFLSEKRLHNACKKHAFMDLSTKILLLSGIRRGLDMTRHLQRLGMSQHELLHGISDIASQ